MYFLLTLLQKMNFLEFIKLKKKLDFNMINNIPLFTVAQYPYLSILFSEFIVEQLLFQNISNLFLGRFFCYCLFKWRKATLMEPAKKSMFLILFNP